jgi:hypothetical protein
LKLTAASTLGTVTLAVGSALRAEGIRAVLTGGACVCLYTRGAYHSKDIDLVVETQVTRSELDGAMGTVGFFRRGDHYEHPRARFHVEFPPGPLAIGDDLAIRPVEIRRSGLRALALSATDCCRDRLAAFYHWNDRQSLRRGRPREAPPSSRSSDEGIGPLHDGRRGQILLRQVDAHHGPLRSDRRTSRKRTTPSTSVHA